MYNKTENKNKKDNNIISKILKFVPAIVLVVIIATFAMIINMQNRLAESKKNNVNSNIQSEQNNIEDFCIGWRLGFNAEIIEF